MSIFMLVWHCLVYGYLCSKFFEIRKTLLSKFVLFFQEYFGCSNLLHFHCILGSACQFLQIRQLGFWKGSCWFLSSIWGLLTSKCYFWSSNIGCVLIHKHRMSLHLFSTLISAAMFCSCRYTSLILLWLNFFLVFYYFQCCCK